MMKPLFILALIFICSGHPASAESKKEELKKIEQKVQSEKAHQEELKKAAEKLENDMKGIKTDLIKTTKSVQKNERSLQEIEEKIKSLQAKKNELDKF